jgi:hypothetical protein
MTIGLLVEILVAGLLAAAIVWAFILDRRLRDLKSGRDGVRQAVADLAGAASRAEHAVAALRQAAETAAVELSARQAQAKAASEELSILVGAAEGLADRLTARAGIASRAPGRNDIVSPARPAAVLHELRGAR